MHNWPLQPCSQDYGLASRNTHIVCVNFIREWRDLQFNADHKRHIFEKLFHGRFIYSQNFCQKSPERKSPKKYFFFMFPFDAWPGRGIRALHLISQHTTYETTIIYLTIIFDWKINDNNNFQLKVVDNNKFCPKLFQVVYFLQ